MTTFDESRAFCKVPDARSDAEPLVATCERPLTSDAVSVTAPVLPATLTTPATLVRFEMSEALSVTAPVLPATLMTFATFVSPTMSDGVCVWLDAAAVRSVRVRETDPVLPLTLTTLATDVKFVMSEAPMTMAPVRPATLMTFATFVRPTISEAECVWLAAAAVRSARVRTTVPVLPCTDCTGTPRPLIVNDPLVVVTVMFAPASTKRLGTCACHAVPMETPTDGDAVPTVTPTESLFVTIAVMPVAPTTVTLTLMGLPR